MDIYLKQDGERIGPFSLENLQGRLDAGELTISAAAWFEGCGDWVTIQDLPGILLPGGDHLVEVATVPPFDAYQGDEPYVFVSYAHKDAAMVYEEITRLHEAGCKIWYDEGIEASNEWPEEIAKAVVGCAVFLVFVTPRATASINCRNEINMALNKRKPFLAIHLEKTELPLGLELRMGDLQAILRYRLPLERYQRKTQDALDQLLGKSPSQSKTSSDGAGQTEDTHGVESAAPVMGDASPSEPQRKSPALALFAVLLIACGFGAYLYFDDDAEGISQADTTTASAPGNAELNESLQELKAEIAKLKADNEKLEEERVVAENAAKGEPSPSERKLNSNTGDLVGEVKNLNESNKIKQIEETMTKNKRHLVDLEVSLQQSEILGLEEKIDQFRRMMVADPAKTAELNPQLKTLKAERKKLAQTTIDQLEAQIAKDEEEIGNLKKVMAADPAKANVLKPILEPKEAEKKKLAAKLVTLATSEKLKAGKPWTVPTLSLDMIWCEPGAFMTGSPKSEKGRSGLERQRKVRLTTGFYLGKHEVTQVQWKKVMKTSPSAFSGDDRPVEKVSWSEAVAFCDKLTEQHWKAGIVPFGWKYSLPTEAQWEYACRAGTTTVFSFGDSLSSKQANFNGVSNRKEVVDGPNLQRTTEVGSHQPNAWGFHDMHGNVSEWCANKLGGYQSGSWGFRAIRGGSWSSSLLQVTRIQQPAPVPNSKEEITNTKGVAIIVSKKGQVTILGADDKPLPATAVTVGGESTIVTGAKGQVVLLFSNGTVHTVKENNKLKLKALRQKPFDPNGEKVTDLLEEPSVSTVSLDFMGSTNQFGAMPGPSTPLRSAHRFASTIDDRRNTLGFRLSLQEVPYKLHKKTRLRIDIKKLDTKSGFDINSPVGATEIRG